MTSFTVIDGVVPYTGITDLTVAIAKCNEKPGSILYGYKRPLATSPINDAETENLLRLASEAD